MPRNCVFFLSIRELDHPPFCITLFLTPYTVYQSTHVPESIHLGFGTRSLDHVAHKVRDNMTT